MSEEQIRNQILKVLLNKGAKRLEEIFENPQNLHYQVMWQLIKEEDVVERKTNGQLQLR